MGGEESRLDPRLQKVLGVLPSAVAITNRKGKVLWRSDALLKLLAGSGAARDLSRLGEGQPEAAAAIFRLFQAASGGAALAETLAVPQMAGGAAIHITATSRLDRSGRVEYLVWQFEEAKAADASESWGGVASLPVPALSIAKDLSVQAASARFEKLHGGSPVGVQAWTLFRTRRGKPFTRTWLRDLIAKADEPVAVQIVTASGATRAGFLHFAGAGDPCLCLVTPSAAAGSLDDSFEALLARAPQPMALTSGKGVIMAANGAFRALFLGNGGELANTELCGKSLALLVADASSQNVRDRIASLGERGGQDGAIELQAVLKGTEGRGVRLVVFPAANGGNLIVTAIEAGADAEVTGRDVLTLLPVSPGRTTVLAWSGGAQRTFVVVVKAAGAP